AGNLATRHEQAHDPLRGGRPPATNRRSSRRWPPNRPFAGGRGGKEGAASLRAEQRLAPGGAAPLPPRLLRETSAPSAALPRSFVKAAKLSSAPLPRSLLRGWISRAPCAG